MKIYLDVCSYNRPFDNQEQDSAMVDVLLTTDDDMVKLANRLTLLVKVRNPLKWISEVL
ncbi:MAG: hypothetical protein LBB91_05145 [Clostridiales bacterium]|nr:hypothetical protein [Clostridiales bacterium]